MKKQSTGVREGRRDFLKGVAVIGAAGTAAAVGGEALADAPAPREKSIEAPKPRGYHVTPHIETYYEKARF